MNREVKTSERRNESISDRFQSPEILDPVIYTICQSLRVEKIFLLGTYPANPPALGDEYDLMVLIDPEDKRPMHEFESLIENRCHDLAMISASVFQIRRAGELLKAGNFFFSFVCDPHKMIFDSGGMDLPGDCNSGKQSNGETLMAEFYLPLSKAKAFLSGAVSYQITKDFQLAAFMVHQTVEQTLNAFLYPFMDYRLQTHNLNKLFLYARRFSIQFNKVFPKDTDREIRLYQTLHKAYIYGRYKNNFQVGEEVLQILITRAAELIRVAESIFCQKVEILKSGMPVFSKD